MTIYVIFQYLLISVAVILIGYQLLLGIFALLPQREPKINQAGAGFNYSFLFVIHLRNKEQEIIKTLYSIYGLVYPANLFKLLVIADNCPEKTVEVVRKFGAIVLECNYTQGKGRQAIHQWAFEQINHWEKKHDAVVIIKPGGLISGNFLEVMNRYFQGGSDVLQSSSFKVNEADTWRLKFSRTVWLIYNHINSLGRKRMGLGTRLMKNGMCFKTRLLKKNDIELAQIIENSDDSLPLLMKGVRIDFAPEAVVWSTSYDSYFEVNLYKRKQESSQFQMAKKYLRHFVNRFIINKSFQDFDTIVGLLTPSLATQLIVTGGMVILNGVFWTLGSISATLFWLWLTLFAMLAIYMLIGVITDRTIFLDLNSDSPQKNNIGFTGTLLC